MSGAMSVFETIGFVATVLGTGLFLAALFILAAYGGTTMYKQWERGAKRQEEDEVIGRQYHETIKGGL